MNVHPHDAQRCLPFSYASSLANLMEQKQFCQEDAKLLAALWAAAIYREQFVEMPFPSYEK